jgi:hypothetical protein
MSSEDLLAKFDELVKRFKEEFNTIIQGKRAKMKAEVEQYNAEKQRMKPFEVSDDDIIHLNIGGQKFTSTRSTLCQVEGSLLATMFSGRWEDGLKRDEDGAVFFDVNPQYFGYVLDYLRSSHEENCVARKPCRIAKSSKRSSEKFQHSKRPSPLRLCQARNLIYTDPKFLFRKTRKSQLFALQIEGINMFLVKIFTNKGEYVSN